MRSYIFILLSTKSLMCPYCVVKWILCYGRMLFVWNVLCGFFLLLLFIILISLHSYAISLNNLISISTHKPTIDSRPHNVFSYFLFSHSLCVPFFVIGTNCVHDINECKLWIHMHHFSCLVCTISIKYIHMVRMIISRMRLCLQWDMTH